MFVKILEDRTPEDRCSVCGSDKSVKYYFIDKEGNRKLLCNKCALTYNPVEESSKEHYIVTMTDYRYANGAYIPVESEEMRKALIKEDIYVGSYPDIETATAAIYNKIETLFGNINTNLPYKINIEVCVYPDKNQKMFYVSSKGQIQVIFKIEKENMFIHRNMINSVYGATGAEQSISAGSCYITHGVSNGSISIKYIYLDTNKCVSSELFKADAYTLLYNINEYADIFTYFYDMRDRKRTKDTLTIVLTGRFPERDSYDPFNTSYIDAYIGDGDPSNNMLNYIKVYNGKYEPGEEKFISRIINEMQSINIPIDNVYIIDKRLLPEEKEDKSSKEKKAISCEIKPSFASRVIKEYDGMLVSYDFGDNEGKTEYYKSLNELITNLKKYTDIFTKFTDKRYGDLESDDKDFALLKIDYNSIYDKYSITVYVNNIAKFMRILSKDNQEINDAFKEALDFCKGYKFFIVSNAGVEKPNSSSTNVDDSDISTSAQIDSDYNSLLGL